MKVAKAPIWVRAARVYREKGAGGVWFGALSHAGYRRLVVLEASLADARPALPVPDATEIRTLGPHDAAAFADLGQGDTGVFRGRCGAGHECWGAWVAGTLRHVAWSGRGEVWVEYLRCRIALGDGVSYAYRAYTDPGFRNVGLASATQSAYLAALRARGGRAVVACVLPDNPWAFAPWLRNGYRRVGVVRALGTGARPRVFLRRAPGTGAAAGWRFVRAGRNDAGRVAAARGAGL